MASFDIVNKLDFQKIDNAVNTAKKELQNRFDLNGSGSDFEYDKKNNTITLISDIDMHLNSMEDILIARMIKQNVDPQVMDLSGDIQPSGKTVRKIVKLKDGIDKEAAKKIIKAIKDSGIKVQASIMEDKVRVTGKKIDDLQATIALCRNGNFEVPLQYDNMKS